MRTNKAWCLDRSKPRAPRACAVLLFGIGEVMQANEMADFHLHATLDQGGKRRLIVRDQQVLLGCAQYAPTTSSPSASRRRRRGVTLALTSRMTTRSSGRDRECQPTEGHSTLTIGARLYGQTGSGSRKLSTTNQVLSLLKLKNHQTRLHCASIVLASCKKNVSISKTVLDVW